MPNLIHLLVVALTLHLICAAPGYDESSDDESLIENLNTKYLESLLEELLSDVGTIRNQADSGNSNDKSCLEKLHVYDQNIIHTKKSIENGAKFVDVQTIGLAHSTVLHESCINLCCTSSDKCDTSLLSLKPGSEGYRCYLFYCNSKCLYEKHDGYSILTLDYELNIQQTPSVTPKINQIQGNDKKINKYLGNLKLEERSIKNRLETFSQWRVWHS